jgi:hypothetical protein
VARPCALAYHRSDRAPAPGPALEDEMGIEVLAVAAVTIAVVWIVVLWGSRYFGPR